MNNCCPLCGATSATILNVLQAGDIWDSLESRHAASFDVVTRSQLTPSSKIELLACHDCGLQYFSPALPGDAAFYSQLSTSDQNFYNSVTWDFRQALQVIPKSAKVLDVACGPGAFLALCRDEGLHATGIDTNPHAIAHARSLGLSVECTLLSDFSQHHAGSFDVVTAFQVVEHLSDVVPFTMQAVKCLKPGGFLLISVPNRDRIWREALEPLDCPPHHLSRWEPRQFAELAERCSLRLHAVHRELASLDHVRNQLRQFMSPEFSMSLPVRAVAKAMINAVTVPERLRPFLFRALNLWDMSMLAVLAKD